MIVNNLWERDQMRKLTTPELVQQQIERCEKGHKSAPSVAKVKEWGRKLVFLDRLKREVSTLAKCLVASLILSSAGCETYKRQAWTPDGFNYTVSRDRKTGDQTDYFGATWNLKP